MTAASRRRARRIKQTRIDQATARVAARRAARDAGLTTSRRLYTRKDREALNSDWAPTGGKKQRYKHSSKRVAKAIARRDVRYARMRDALTAATADLPVRPVDLNHFGGGAPMLGWGTAVDASGTELLWTFRYRFDRGFLEVGVGDREDYQPMVVECRYAASRDDVFNDPYRGYLDTAEGVSLLTELFNEAAAPEAGSRFGERMQNTLDLSLGRGGDPDAPTLIRYAD